MKGYNSISTVSNVGIMHLKGFLHFQRHNANVSFNRGLQIASFHSVGGTGNSGNGGISDN